MPKRTANATWNGDLEHGDGTMAFGSGAFEGAYSFASRFEEGDEPGTNPEELIGAAHAGCFSMALAGDLGRAGYDPQSVETEATVHLEKGESGFSIVRSHLETTAEVPNVDEDEFQQIAEGAKENCPVSRALGGVEKTLDASLTR